MAKKSCIIQIAPYGQLLSLRDLAIQDPYFDHHNHKFFHCAPALPSDITANKIELGFVELNNKVHRALAVPVSNLHDFSLVWYTVSKVKMMYD